VIRHAVTGPRPDVDVTAQDLARAAGRTVPRAMPWHRLLAARVPLAGEGVAGRCKRCGRALPRFSDPIPFGTMGRLPLVRFERSRMESALLCLVCGPRSAAGRALSAVDILDAATDFAAMVGTRHWHRWNRLLRRALAVEVETARVEEVGQALELFRRFGPGRTARRRHPDGDPLETLVVSSARHWPRS
jgi:hypothetical protein